ncbi:MAG: ATP-binding protein, partial [Verrucomicrobiota bacterium]
LVWDELFPKLIESWVPHAIGILVLSPFILAWASPSFLAWDVLRKVEAGVCWTGLCLSAMLSFNSWFFYGVANYPLAYLPYPFVVWSALRFGQRGATTGTLTISSIAIYTLLDERGPFVASTEKESLMLIGSYIGILAVTNMLLAAAAVERDKAEESARKSEALFKLISDNVSDLIAVTDSEGRRLYNSPSYQKVFGEIELRPGSEAFAEIHSDDVVRVREAFRKTFATHQGERIEFRFQLPDGELRFIESQGNYVAGERGEPGKLISIARDVTERKRFEEELSKARDAALDLARAKAEFLANMSHEIRTPLNGVIGMTQLLMHTPLTPQQREYVSTVRTSADSLMEIINQILDLSKIEAGKLTFENLRFDLTQPVESVLDVLGMQCQAKGIELTCVFEKELPRQVCGDPMRVRQILLNLAGNAVKFTSRGDVTLQVSTHSRTETHTNVCFEVRDTGIGIPPDAQSRLFSAFTQADGSTTRKFGGTGLGLAISKNLCEIMGGTIGVRSTPGQGSTFWFVLPFVNVAGDPPIRSSSENLLQGKRVFIATAHRPTLRMLESYFRLWQITPQGSEDLPGALPLLREAAALGAPFDLLILDLQCVESNAETFVAALRSDQKMSRTRIVVLIPVSGGIDPSTISAWGLDGYIVKPVKPSSLFDQVVNAFSERANLPAIPVLQPPAVVESTTAPHRRPRQPLRILLAEDNIVNQQVALGQLDLLGYAADVANNGIEAIEAVKQRSYDLILMDCQMPELDGYGASRRIREMEKELNFSGKRSAVYIIAMTAHAMAGDKEKCLAAGMNDYLSKPVDQDQLQAALEKWQALNQEFAQPAGQSLESIAALGLTVSQLPVNLQRLQSLAYNDPVKVQRMIKIYFTQADDLMSKLETAIQDGIAADINFYAHKLAGSSSTCGINIVALPMQELEQKASANDLADAARLFAAAKTGLSRARQIIDEQTGAD